jgi:protein ImuB
VARVSDIEVILDVSGLGQLIGEPSAIGAELVRAVTDAGVDASVALAPTGTAARLLAAGAAMPVTVAMEPASALAPLPIDLLEALESLPPGTNVRERARPYETLERWGIRTLGDLAVLPSPDLSTRLARRGIALQRLARGLDPRPFVPDPDTPRYLQRLELEWPIDAIEPLSFILARLLDPLSSALERADRGAAAVRLDLRLTDRSTHARVLQLPAAMRDPRVLRTLLLLDLESHPPAAAIDIVSVEVDPAPARITQFSLLERAVPSPETLSTLMARLSALVGESRCGAAALVDTHRPGAFEMRRLRQGAEGAKGADGAEGAGANGAEGAGADGAGADGAGADGAGAGGARAVVRRQRRPPAIRVAVDRARPVHVAVARRGMPGGAVLEAAGPWRTSGDWWTSGEGSAVPWNRDEWDVALSDGSVCRIFQDRSTSRWFLDGMYD